MVGVKIARLNKMREPGYLYYVKDDEDGYLCVYRSEMGKNRKKKIKKDE